MDFQRPNKFDYFLKISEAVAARSTCLRRQYGAIIVNGDRIVSTGYNGAARGVENCCDHNSCVRDELNIPHGERYELCKAVHAEANAIINGNRMDMEGSSLYLFGFEDGEPLTNPEPCAMCDRFIRNAGISRVFVRGADGHAKLFKTYNNRGGLDND